MKIFRHLLLFLCLPTLTYSGIFDWFFPEEKPLITQFECPYNCGGVGSESLSRLEVQAMKVLWELDRFSHVHQNIPFYDKPPSTFSDPWAQKLIRTGIDFTFGNCHENLKLPHLKDECLTESDKCRCGCIKDIDGTYTAHWRLKHCYADGNETYLGKLFKVSYGFRLSNEEFRCDERDSFCLADPQKLMTLLVL